MDRQQREFLLRQQLAAIRKELGEGDDDVVGEYRARLADLDVPPTARTFIDKELDRLERTSAQSPEHGWLRTWLDRVFELPWGVRSDDAHRPHRRPASSSTPTTTASPTSSRASSSSSPCASCATSATSTDDARAWRAERRGTGSDR